MLRPSSNWPHILTALGLERTDESRPGGDSPASSDSYQSRRSRSDSIVSRQFSDADQSDSSSSAREKDTSDELLTDSVGDRYEICPRNTIGSDTDRHSRETTWPRRAARHRSRERRHVITLRRIRSASQPTIEQQLEAARQRRNRRLRLEAHHLETESEDGDEDEDNENSEEETSRTSGDDHDHTFERSRENDDDDNGNGYSCAQPQGSTDSANFYEAEASTDSFDCSCHEACRREEGNTDDSGDSEEEMPPYCRCPTPPRERNDDDDESSVESEEETPPYCWCPTPPRERKQDDDESSDESSIDMSEWPEWPEFPRPEQPRRRSPYHDDTAPAYRAPLTGYTLVSPMRYSSPGGQSIGKRISIALDSTPTSSTATTNSDSDTELDNNGGHRDEPTSSDDDYFTDDTAELVLTQEQKLRLDLSRRQGTEPTLMCYETMPVSSCEVSSSSGNTDDSAVQDIDGDSVNSSPSTLVNSLARALSATRTPRLARKEKEVSDPRRSLASLTAPSTPPTVLLMMMHTIDNNDGADTPPPSQTLSSDESGATGEPVHNLDPPQSQSSTPDHNSPHDPDRLNALSRSPTTTTNEEEWDDMEDYLATGHFYSPVHGSSVSSVLKTYLNGGEGDQASIHSTISDHNTETEEESVTLDMIPTADEILWTTWNQVCPESGSSSAQREEWHQWVRDGGHYTHSRDSRPTVRRRLSFSTPTEDKTEPTAPVLNQSLESHSVPPPSKAGRFDDLLPQHCGARSEPKQTCTWQPYDMAGTSGHEPTPEYTNNNNYLPETEESIQLGLLLPNAAEQAYAASVAKVACEEIRLRRIAGFERPTQRATIEQRVGLEFARLLTEVDPNSKQPEREDDGAEPLKD